MKKILLAGCFLLPVLFMQAQSFLQNGKWRALLHRSDGHNIVFSLRLSDTEGKAPVAYILNGKEAMKVSDIRKEGDSLWVNMPVFESSFRLKRISKDSISGEWVRQGADREQAIPFSATARQPERFPALYGKPRVSAAGKWAIQFGEKEGKTSPAIGEFQQQGALVTGSILTPTGDYRYLEGIVSGDSLWLSTFDGVHALVLAAKLDAANKTLTGSFTSGARSFVPLTGKKENNPTLPNTAEMFVKEGEPGYLDFAFPDLKGDTISIKDNRFKNKVVIIDLMGSWCPNCMDETAFLSDFYKKNKSRGVEVVGLAYEMTTDFQRSQKSLSKFQKQFDVQYPMLITGVTVMDEKRTEKTLPQLTPIKMFPTTIILDKTGKVAYIDTGFQGPGTGEYHTAFVKEFNQLIDKLLAQ